MTTKTVTIPSRFSHTPCWTGEIEGTGSEARNLGRAVLAALKAGANLTGAKLSGANLTGAKLSGADLYGADLSGADLSWADLSGAILSRADMTGADLTGTDMTGAKLSGADMTGAKDADLAIARTRILPEGVIIGYKKVRLDDENTAIAKLRIPEDAKRSHAFGRKCRAEFAEVLEIRSMATRKPVKQAHSSHDNRFIYRPGETVRPANGFSENWHEECEAGIHFFITRIEAENY